LFFTVGLGTLGVTSLLFLDSLNYLLRRLSAMLPDENLREETRHFTTLNRFLVFASLFLGLGMLLILHYPTLVPDQLDFLLPLNTGNPWLTIFLVLLPLAMTMALLWKTKETILDSLFSQGG
jgi:hypothetical protein